MSKIYRVKLKQPIDDKIDYYFGSLSAIYDVFSVEQIGCTVGHLWNIKVSNGERYENDKCTITQETLIRKTTNRGKK